MDQDKFDDLMGAAHRCVEEAKTLALRETPETINEEVVETIERIIGSWIDMREGVITGLAKDANPVIPKWRWITMKKRRDLERNEHQQRKVLAAPIVKHFPAELKVEAAFRSEDQVDGREVVLGRRTENELRKGMWSHVKEAMFIGCMMPIESDAYAFTRVREHWNYNRNLRLEDMPREERREVEICLYQRAEMIRKSGVMSSYRRIREDAVRIEENDTLSRRSQKEGIKKEFEKVVQMLNEEPDPEARRRDEAITNELKMFITDMAYKWVPNEVRDEEGWLFTYEPTAQRGDAEMPIFKKITYGHLADEEEVTREGNLMKRGARRKKQVDYFEDKIPIKPAPKEVPEEEELFFDHGELIRVMDEGRVEGIDQVEERENSSKESTFRRGESPERGRRSPQIKKKKVVGDKSASPSRSIYGHSDLSAITTTMGDAAIASSQSSNKAQSQERTSSTMGTAKRRELYDQHQDAPLNTGRGRTNNPYAYLGSREYQGSQRSSNYSAREDRSYQSCYDYGYQGSNTLYQGNEQRSQRSNTFHQGNEQRSQGPNTFYQGRQDDWREIQQRKARQDQREEELRSHRDNEYRSYYEITRYQNDDGFRGRHRGEEGVRTRDWRGANNTSSRDVGREQGRRDRNDADSGSTSTKRERGRDGSRSRGEHRQRGKSKERQQGKLKDTNQERDSDEARKKKKLRGSRSRSKNRGSRSGSKSHGSLSTKSMKYSSEVTKSTRYSSEATKSTKYSTGRSEGGKKGNERDGSKEMDVVGKDAMDVTDAIEATIGPKGNATSGSGGMSSSKAATTGNTSTSGNMLPLTANQGNRRNISVDSVLKQAKGDPEEAVKCLWHQKVDRFNNGEVEEFEGVQFHYERMTYGGEEAMMALYQGRLIYGTAGKLFASQEAQTAAVAPMNERFRAEYLRHRGMYILVTENQVRSIVIQLYGTFDQESFHSDNLGISFTHNDEIGLYHVDIVGVKEQLGLEYL